MHKTILLMASLLLLTGAARAEKVVVPETGNNPYLGYGEQATVLTSKGAVTVMAPQINRPEEERAAIEQQMGAGGNALGGALQTRQPELPVGAIVSFRGSNCPVGWTFFPYFGDFRAYGIVTCEKV